MDRTGLLVLLLVLAGCGSPTAPGSDGWPWHSMNVTGQVAFEGRSQLTHDTVEVRLVLSNRGSAGAEIKFGVCAFAVEGIGQHGMSWDNHPAQGMACADFALLVTLVPGESRSIPIYRGAASQIRAAVPSDYYRITIGFREGGTMRRIPGGGLTL